MTSTRWRVRGYVRVDITPGTKINTEIMFSTIKTQTHVKKRASLFKTFIHVN